MGEYYIRGEIFRGTEVFFVDYVNSKQLFLKRVFKDGRMIYSFTESSDNITYFTMRNFGFGLSFEDRLGGFLGEVDSIAAPVENETMLFLNTTDVNQFGLALAGVFYSFSRGTGACINFDTTEGLQSQSLIVPNVIFGRETSESVCERVDDVLPREIAWFNGQKEFKSWTTEVQCQNNIFYPYCKFKLTCGEGNNCFGPCPEGEQCVLNDDDNFECKNLNPGEDVKLTTLYWVIFIIIFVVVIFMIIVLINEYADKKNPPPSSYRVKYKRR